MLADSILALQPGHLFGLVIRMTERWTRDAPTLAAAQREFLEVYDREMAAGRRDCQEHRTIIDQFLRQARGEESRP